MKKLYSLIILFLPLLSLAQPTITTTGLPVPGLVYVMGTDDNYNAAILPGGANQVWDYSGLLNNNNDTSGFMPAAGTPFTSSFPSATLASHDVITDSWIYFITDGTGFYLNGATGPITPTGGTIIYNPPQLFAPVPFTYNDTRNVTSRIVVDTTVTIIVFTYNAQFVRRIEDSFVADGWGSIILPSGTYNNVLRLKITELVYDSAYYDPNSNGVYVPAPSFAFTPTVTQTTIYRYVQDQQPAYLLGINADSLGNTAVSSEYLTAFVVLSNHDVNAPRAEVRAYPNPTANDIYLDNNLNTAAELVITNSLGQTIDRRTVNNEKLIKLDVGGFSNGLYQFSLISSGEKQNGRFTVQH